MALTDFYHEFLRVPRAVVSRA